MPEVLHALCRPVLHAQILSKSPYGGKGRGNVPAPFQPRGNAVICQLRVVAESAR